MLVALPYIGMVDRSCPCVTLVLEIFILTLQPQDAGCTLTLAEVKTRSYILVESSATNLRNLSSRCGCGVRAYQSETCGPFRRR